MSESPAELLGLEQLPDDPSERLAMLREMVHADRYLAHYCPECGADLTNINIVAHAREHYPEYIPARLMSPEATAREAALYQLAKRQPPRRF